MEYEKELHAHAEKQVARAAIEAQNYITAILSWATVLTTEEEDNLLECANVIHAIRERFAKYGSLFERLRKLAPDFERKSFHSGIHGISVDKCFRCEVDCYDVNPFEYYGIWFIAHLIDCNMQHFEETDKETEELASILLQFDKRGWDEILNSTIRID